MELAIADPRDDARVVLSELARLLVLRDQGLATGVGRAARREAGTVKPREVAIITLKNRTLSPVAQLFIETVRAVAKPLAKIV